jgi:hypothetical protein
MREFEGSNARGIGRVDYGNPFHNPLLLPEILALVFSYLDAVDLARVSAVCRTWQICCADEVCT